MRILAYTSPARGHLFPITPALDELRDRGHRVAVRTLASQVGLMRSRGLDAAPIDPAIEAIEHDDFRGRGTLAKMRRALDTFVARAPHEAAGLQAALEQERPDALLVDIQAWGALAAAERWGGPWASWCPFPLPLPSRDAPPFGPGLRPARGRAGRLRDRALTPLIVGGYERQVVPRINGLRASLGMAPVARVGEFLAGAPLVLYLTAEPFEYPRTDWPPNVRMVGPRLRAAVREAIARAEGARRVAAAFARAGGAPGAADAVEELAARAVVEAG